MNKLLNLDLLDYFIWKHYFAPFHFFFYLKVLPACMPACGGTRVYIAYHHWLPHNEHLRRHEVTLKITCCWNIFGIMCKVTSCSQCDYKFWQWSPYKISLPCAPLPHPPPCTHTHASINEVIRRRKTETHTQPLHYEVPETQFIQVMAEWLKKI